MNKFKKNWLLGLFLIVFIILRIPSLFEPHWYGDEGIYASVAYALEQGKKLYIDVFDNRLPVIYYLYRLGESGTRLFFVRVLNIIAGIISLIGIYAISKRLGLNRLSIIPLIIATYLLGTPVIEGNIANTENFFLPLNIGAVWFVLNPTPINIFLAGLLFGLAFLIKFVPFFTFCAVGIYIFLLQHFSWKEKFNRLFLLGIGFLLPILTNFIFLFLNSNAIHAFQFALLNNLYYVNYYNHIGVSLLTKTISIFILLSAIIILYIKKNVSNYFFLIFTLLLLDLYAALFSNRAYPHYLLQAVPSVALFSGIIFQPFKKNEKIQLRIALIFIGYVIICLSSLILYKKSAGIPVMINLKTYYGNFLSFIKSNNSQSDKLPFFYGKENPQLNLARIAIKKFKTKNIYFYTDDSWIYDYAQVVPPTFFIPAYHQYLIPKGDSRLIEDLEKSRPHLIMVDKKKTIVDPFKKYLKKNYQKNSEDDYFEYYIRINL